MGKVHTQAVKAGEAALPDGIVDTSAGADDFELHPELEKDIDRILGLKKAKAKYKLEISFSEERSAHRPFAGIVSAFSNGGFAHGGGDEGIYFCPQPLEDGKLCYHPLDPIWLSNGHAVCPSCRNVLDPKKLTQFVFARLTMQHWAHQMLYFFRRLEHNADIRLVFMGQANDLRKATVTELEKSKRGDVMNGVRTRRHSAIYPLANILKDTAAGADLYTRFRAFLNS
jgi:hypothetical protein